MHMCAQFFNMRLTRISGYVLLCNIEMFGMKMRKYEISSVSTFFPNGKIQRKLPPGERFDMF